MTMEPISEDAFSAVLQEEEQREQQRQPRVGKASPKLSHAYVKAKETETTDRTSLMEKKNDDDSAEEGSEEDEEYLPFHILPHIRERLLLLYLSVAVFLLRGNYWSRFNASVALEMYFVVYVLLRFVLPVVVELARMGWRRAKKTILFSGLMRTPSVKKKKKNSDERTKHSRKRASSRRGNNSNNASLLLRRSIDLGSRDFIQHHSSSSDQTTVLLRVDKQKSWTSGNANTNVPKMSLNLAGIVNETHKNAFVESVVENNSERKNSAADLTEREDVVWEKIHTGSIESAKMPCRYRMYCSTSTSSRAHGKHIARIKTEIAIDNIDADVVAKVQLDEHRRNVWGDSSTTSRILARDEEKECDLIFWRVNYPRLMAPRDYIGIRRVWHDEVTRSTISVCVDANGSEEAYKKKKHTQVQLGGGGYDVQHLYAASLIQPKFDDDMPRGKNGEKVENGAMLVSTYCEAPGVPRKLVHMTAAKGLDEYMLSFHRELRREIRMRKRLEREGGIQSVKSFDSTNSLGEPGNDANLNKNNNNNNYGGEKNSNNNNNNSDTDLAEREQQQQQKQQQHLFDDDPDIVDEEERAERRRLRETPLHLRRNARFLRSMLRNGLRKLANRLEEKEEREKLKFQAAASLTDSEKERVRTRQENRQKRRVALKQWTKRTIGIGVVFVAKVLKDGKEE